MYENKTFALAYVRALADVTRGGAYVPSVTDPLSPGSTFGRGPRATRELIGYQLRVLDPHASLVHSPSRPLRLAYCYASLLWTIAGSDDLAWIAHYNPNARQFSDDGRHLAGAFGMRLFASSAGNNPIGRIRDILTRDPSSRRAVASILMPNDQYLGTRDFPCALAVQYFVRSNRLHAVTYMRSQSALMVLPYDAFLFMGLQCVLAAQLDMEAGSYVHSSGSFHIYEDELATAQSVLDDVVFPVWVGPFPSDPSVLDRLLEFEIEIRQSTVVHDTASVMRLAGEATSPTDFESQCRFALSLHAALAFPEIDLVSRLVELADGHMKQLAEAYIERSGAAPE